MREIGALPAAFIYATPPVSLGESLAFWLNNL
jgi:hypothetical protein